MNSVHQIKVFVPESPPSYYIDRNSEKKQGMRRNNEGLGDHMKRKTLMFVLSMVVSFSHKDKQ